MTVVEVLNVQRAHKLRVEDFFLLSDSGALDDCGKTELIEGEIIVMNAQYRPHLRVKMGLYDALRHALEQSGMRLTAFIEGTIAMPPHNAPGPDIMVTAEPDGEGAVPVESVKLVVEVSVTTLPFDLGPKALLYARYGVPEYWVADLTARMLHQMWEPGDGGYARSRQIAFGEEIVAETLGGIAVATAALG